MTDLASRVFGTPVATDNDSVERAPGINMELVDAGDFYHLKIPKSIPLDLVTACKPDAKGNPSKYVYTVLRAPRVQIALTGTDPTSGKPASARFNSKPLTWNLMLKVA
jgi:hypothetical protein